MRCLTILLGNCFLLLVSLASCEKVSLAEEAVFSIPVDTTFMRLRQWEWYCQKRADSCLTENNYQGALSWLDSARIQVELTDVLIIYWHAGRILFHPSI